MKYRKKPVVIEATQWDGSVGESTAREWQYAIDNEKKIYVHKNDEPIVARRIRIDDYELGSDGIARRAPAQTETILPWDEERS